MGLFSLLQAFGLHEHEESVGTEHDHEEESAFIWKALVVLASIYGFFLFETLMHLCLKSRIGEHGGHSHVDVKVGVKLLRECNIVLHISTILNQCLPLINKVIYLLVLREEAESGELLMHSPKGTQKNLHIYSSCYCVLQLPGPSSRHMSFKKKRSCSNFEHHEGGPPIGKTDEKPPMENGDIVLKNIVSEIYM